MLGAIGGPMPNGQNINNGSLSGTQGPSAGREAKMKRLGLMQQTYHGLLGASGPQGRADLLLGLGGLVISESHNADSDMAA